MTSVDKICTPALIYLVFALTQIIIDIFKSLYSQAFFKFIQMIFFTLLLHILCARGLGIVSWIVVFIPFILMTVITAILMIVFGLNPSSGDYTVDVNETSEDRKRRRNKRTDITEDTIKEDEKEDEDEKEKEDEEEKEKEIDEIEKEIEKEKDTRKEREIIIVNPESNKAYKIEGLTNSESLEPPEMNTTSPNVFIRNIRKRI
tara:strand:+ start:201 stop:809 length:609 start_codon:yes stop_codon:yes gene_type:complete